MSNGQTPDFIPAAPQQQQAAPDFIPAAPPPTKPAATPPKAAKTPPGAPQQTLVNKPSFWSREGQRELILNKVIDPVTRAFPTIGGIVGGLAGGAAGTAAEPGGGTVGGAIAGATLGGGIGKEAEQAARWSIFGETPPPTVGKEAKVVGRSMIEQGVGEAFGQVGGWALGKMLMPADRAAMLSFATTGSKFSDEMKLAMPDLNKAAAALPTGSQIRSIGDWQKVIQKGIDDNTAEFNAALAPVANQQIVPQPVAAAIKARIRPQTTAEDAAYNNVLRNRALEYETTHMPNRQPWTYENLNRKRIDLQGNPRAYQTGTLLQGAKADANKAADLAAEEAIKDILYPLADTNMGKPTDYFRNLQSRTSAMLTLKKATASHVEQLAAASTKKAGAPLSSKVNVRVRSWGGVPKPAAGINLGSPETLESAGKRIAEATAAPSKVFGIPTKGAGAAAAVKTPTAKEVISMLPVRSIFAYWDQTEKRKKPAAQPQSGGTQ